MINLFACAYIGEAIRTYTGKVTSDIILEKKKQKLLAPRFYLKDAVRERTEHTTDSIGISLSKIDGRPQAEMILGSNMSSNERIVNTYITSFTLCSSR